MLLRWALREGVGKASSWRRLTYRYVDWWFRFMYCIQVEYDPVSYGYPNVEQP